MLSYIDMGISFNAVVVALMLTAVRLRIRSTRLAKLLCIFILILEVSDIIIGIVVISTVNGSDALTITEELFQAKCFSRIGDRAVLDITDELEGFQTLAIVEVVGDLFAMLLHLFELFEYNHSGEQVEANLITTAAFAFSIVIDFSEFLLAVLSLFQFLLPAIDGFSDLYESMNDPNPAAASAVTALPCFYTSCTHGGVCSSSTVGDASISQASSMPIWAVLVMVVVLFLICAVVLAKLREREVDISAEQKALRMCRVLFTGLP